MNPNSFFFSQGDNAMSIQERLEQILAENAHPAIVNVTIAKWFLAQLQGALDAKDAEIERLREVITRFQRAYETDAALTPILRDDDKPSEGAVLSGSGDPKSASKNSSPE